ncbi:peptidylprolyl isomerase [Larsenimonas salina]|uniref:peptidylprolyl isomerase n=1 Tax=Larsenimonas salina TaxID=1295565 RepID=UPI002073C130|nr:peptidylprolyl isomerase [Larsenimonas salina]MCM5703909.1 peptidylprolyl isomerase [Larsenimonas salina]
MRKTLLAPLGLAAVIGLSPLAHAAAQPLDRIVAVVNQDAIMQSDLNRRLQEVREQLDSRGVTPPPMETLKREVLDRMILEDIQLQMAKRANVSVDDDQLSQSLRQVAKSNGFESVQAFQAALGKQGVSFDSVREQVRREMIISQVQRQKVAGRVSVSDREVEQYLDHLGAADKAQYHLAHILVSLPENASAAQVAKARAQAEKLRTQLEASGKSFEEMAGKLAQQNDSLSGGDLGWRPRNELPTIFADVVPAMSKGEISEPIRSASGFHLVELVDKKGGQQKLISQVKARHILISPNPNRSDAKARALAERVYNELKQGADFDALAKQYSDDKGTALNGGELGWSEPSEMVPAFAKALESLPQGQISEPVKSRFGYHVIEVEGRRQRDVTEQAQREQIRQKLFTRKVNEELESWQQEIRASAYVDNRLDDGGS